MSLVEGAPNTTAQVDAALKQLYKDSNEASAYFDERPGFGLLPKDESFGGRNEPIVVNYTRTGGRSATFADAQTVAAARQKRVEDFLITDVDDYSLVRVPGKTMAHARNTVMAWDELVASLAQKGLDDVEENLANALETYIYRSGNGALCVIAAVSESDPANTLTLTNPEDACLFELGDYVVACDSAGAETANSEAYVSAINIPAKQVTVSDVTDGAYAEYDAADYIGFMGDTANGSSNVKISGFAAWIPSSTPSASESFFGVDRSVSSRLYGKYMDHSSQSREQALFRALTQLGLEGAAPTLGLTCFTEYRALLEELEMRKEIVHMNPVREQGLVATIGYQGVRILGPKSSCNIISSIKMLPGESVLIRPEDWKLHSCGPAISLEDHDGLTIQRLPTEDAYEGRMVFRGQLSCKRPGRQGRVLLAGAS
jgi:hypothetical protein